MTFDEGSAVRLVNTIYLSYRVVAISENRCFVCVLCFVLGQYEARQKMREREDIDKVLYRPFKASTVSHGLIRCAVKH